MGSMQCNVEFGYQLSICSGTKENLDQVGRSQDLPNATDSQSYANDWKQHCVGYNVDADTTEIVVSFHCCDRSGIVAFVLYHGRKINKPFQSNGHLLIVTHVGGSHNRLLLYFDFDPMSASCLNY
jgi:hypothetical protein